MAWFVSRPESYFKSLDEIKKQRDRGAAIIAAAVLEDHLLEAIQSRLHKNEKVEAKMFKGLWPAGQLLGAHRPRFPSRAIPVFGP